MKKILVLGASGMAGHVVFTYLSEQDKYDLLGTTNSTDFNSDTKKVDIFDPIGLVDVIKSFKPDFVINCVGMLIKGAKNFPDKTIYANSYFPHLLAGLSGDFDFKLIHLSTDCVFSGKKGNYIETSFKDATDIYGLSKSLGEIVDSKNLTIRTSIIGPEIKSQGEGLFHWFMQQNDDVYGFKNNIWSGVTTLELAKFINWLISNNNSLTGLFHLTNSVPISKYDLLTLFKQKYNKDVQILDGKDYISNKSFVNTNTEIDYKVSTFEKMIDDQKKFMDEHIDFYKYY